MSTHAWPEIPQVVDVAGRPAGDVGVDPEAPVQIEARLLDLGIERGDEKLDARHSRRRSRGWPTLSGAQPAEDDPLGGRAVDRQQLATPLEDWGWFPEEDDVLGVTPAAAKFTEADVSSQGDPAAKAPSVP